MRQWLNLSHISTGFVVVLVGYTSSAVIVFQAAAAAGASAAELSSWLWALGIGMGATSIGLSLYYKKPVVTAWSTPGAALLVTSLAGLDMAQAIGVFLFSSGLIALCGLTGWFNLIMRQVPVCLAAAMLGGVLLNFGLDLFLAADTSLWLVIAMLGSYLLLKPVLPRYCIPLVLCVGIAGCVIGGELAWQSVDFELAVPLFIMPEFSWSALIGVGIPLFVVTMASQNVPGVAVIRANGYDTPISPLISTTGLTGVLLAPFGGFSFCLAAITAAICMSEEADPDAEQRYRSSVWAGVFYVFAGVFGATVAALFAAFPQALIMCIAGLALLSTIANSLSAAFTEAAHREAAMLTFLLTASGVSLLGVSSAFWGLLLGLLAYHSRKLWQPVTRAAANTAPKS
ncbi:benzoate/H(+) symporter BenE family transporter [Aliamphritea ceti]|uniref:benzoate/H(+) symporter BenE family transporter n=1 Tax=Aliamphritea ceti TaxID=1524258 RepID=UPI0021C37299|nr:benzoate/H(+) symporter BenE family transporter [Aliamphritea ceti]